jgi:hypothetical protein
MGEIMTPQVPTSMDIEWAPLSQKDLARFAPQMAAGLQWILNVLDETERARKLPRTSYDQAIQDRLRRAS